MRKKQTVIRNKTYGITFGIAFVCVMLFAACDNTPNLSDGNGYGRISISFEGGAASQTIRTVLPSTAFDKYVYTFTKSGGAAVEKTPDKNGFFTLELGSYTVEVKAYIGTAEPYTLVASGVSSQFTVSSGSNAAVYVLLSEVNSSGQGKFSYTITYPSGAAAEITLQKWPGLNNIALNPGNIANGKTQTLHLDTGSYLLTVLVNKNGSVAGISEAVHITSSLSTVYTKNFNDNDLIAPIAVSAVTVKPSTSLVVGGTETLYAEIEPSYATDKRVTWEVSSNPDVAEVSENGLVTAKKAGTATITVTSNDGNKTASCIVTVISWDVYDEASWNEVTNRIKIGGNNKVYTVIATGNFSIPGVTANTFGSVTGINITIIGDKEISLAAGSTGSLLRIGENQTVIVRDLDLKGHNANDASLVYIIGANSSFIMQGSAMVSGNTNSGDDIWVASPSHGGGVYVGSGGTFTMQGNAMVSGNTDTSSYSSPGGGVYVDSGTFTMQGSATVFGNTTTSLSSTSGGGVYLGSGGTFTMQGNATVSGNIASINDTAVAAGSSVRSGGGVAIFSGTFTMQGSAAVSGNTVTGTLYGYGVFIGRSGIGTMLDNATVSGNTGNGVGVWGTFTMQNNATVSDHAAKGVEVDGSSIGGMDVKGTFTMQDNATVSGNLGDGVELSGSDAVFTMKGGTISGNKFWGL
jgi:uncharacterized protein YjdB